MPTIDPERRREHSRRWYDKNKHVYLERNERKRQERIAYVIELKSRTPCSDCGLRYPSYVMDFDHRPDEIKIRNVANIVANGSMRRLIEEIAKCDLVCANCHRERTHGPLRR